MMTSRALKAVSRDSKAALEKWKRAAQEIDAINSLQPSPGNGDPRFICNPPRVTHCDHAMMVFIMNDSIEDSDFARLTPHKQFTLLFQFQAQCAANALRSFDFGGRSMHGYACHWTTWSEEDTLEMWQQKHNELGELAPRRSHLLQVRGSLSLCGLGQCICVRDAVIVPGYCVLGLGLGRAQIRRRRRGLDVHGLPLPVGKI